MKEFIVNVSADTSKVYLQETSIAVDGENLAGKMIFKFNDKKFVDGLARLEWKQGNDKYFQNMVKVDNTYQLPIRNVMTHEGRMDFQLVITQLAQDEEIPVFKSNSFYVYVEKAINAEGEPPEEYWSWIDEANEKLLEFEQAIEEVERLNIDAERVSDGVEVTITDKQGEPHTTKVNDGEQGPVGPQGPKGEDGNSGVYLGTEEPTNPDQNVWIDTDGEGEEYVTSDEVLKKTNTTEYNPTSDYNPATKKYVDDNIKPTVLINQTIVDLPTTATSAEIAEYFGGEDKAYDTVMKLMNGCVLASCDVYDGGVDYDKLILYAWYEGDDDIVGMNFETFWTTGYSENFTLKYTISTNTFEVTIPSASQTKQYVFTDSHIDTPTEYYHIANKSYVDDSIATAIGNAMDGEY